MLNMGQPVRIVELAERMITLSGLEPGRDIAITFTGIRRGERLNEVLFAAGEPSSPIGIEGIVAVRPGSLPVESMRRWLTALEKAIVREDQSAIVKVFIDAIADCRVEPSQRVTDALSQSA